MVSKCLIGHVQCLIGCFINQFVPLSARSVALSARSVALSARLVDLSARSVDLSARLVALSARSVAVLSLSDWPGWFSQWTGLFPLEDRFVEVELSSHKNKIKAFPELVHVLLRRYMNLPPPYSLLIILHLTFGFKTDIIKCHKNLFGSGSFVADTCLYGGNIMDETE